MLSRTLPLQRSARLRSQVPRVRWTSSLQNPSTTKRYISTHLLAGIAGGLVVIGAGYSYYHFSGIKRAVDASKQVRVYLEQAKQSVANKHPNEALNYLRQLTKSYAAIVPGSGLLLDRLFNSVDQIVAEHGEEASLILAKAQQEIDSILKEKVELTNAELASKIVTVVGKHLNEIGKLGAKAGSPLLQPVKDKLPDTAYVSKKAEEGVGLLAGYFGRGKD